MRPETWSLNVDLSWPRSVRFYQRRLDFLGGLEEEGILRAFQVGENRLAARIAEPGHELVLRSNGIEARIRTPERQRETIEKSMRKAIQLMEPTRVTSILISLQQLVPLSGDYDEVRSQSAAAVFGPWKSGIRLTDYAALINGVWEAPELDFAVEFGIVSRSEVRQRMERKAGRMPDPGDASFPAGFWERIEPRVPELALFVDAYFSGSEPGAVEGGRTSPIEEVLDKYWTGAEEAAATLAMDALAKAVPS